MPHTLSTDMENTPASSSVAGRPASNAARSCLTCAKAKAKCVRQSGQQICERCSRLNKECHMKEPVQRKRRPPKLTRTAQLENLENRLHTLVHALQAQQQAANVAENENHGHPSPSTTSGTSDKGNSTVEYLITEQNPHTASCTTTAKSTVPTPSSSFQPTQPVTMDITISLAEAAALLDRYKRLMAPAMPFVVIPDGTDAWELAHEKPFLMQAIATVSCFHDLPRQQFMVKDLMRQISERIIIRNEKSIEVLQGMLILIAWYHPHLIWAQQSVLLLHLAMSLVADLNIDRAPDSCEKFRLANGSNAVVPPFSNEERRAFLGAYYLTSMMSTSFKKLSALKWSPWMTDCAKTLEMEDEYESDAYLVATVRIQHLMEDVMAVEAFEAPIRYVANSYEADLDRIPKPPLSGRAKLLLEQQIASARVAIWTNSLTGLAESKSKNGSELRQRLDGLWRCVQAVHAYFELYLAMPADIFLTLPFQTFGQSVLASVTLLRLATLEVDGWDPAALREDINYSTIVGETMRQFEAVEAARPDGIQVNNESFTKWAAKLRYMKNLFDQRYPSGASRLPPVVPDVSVGGRQWPGNVPQQQQQQTTAQYGAPDSAAQQQPTPSEDWLANPSAVFTYFDDAFWNSFNFDNLDFAGAAAAPMPSLQVPAAGGAA